MIQLDEKTEIQEGLEEYYQMKLDNSAKMDVTLEDEMSVEAGGGYQERMEEKKVDIIERFVYVNTRSHGFCEKCNMPTCRLIDVMLGCGYVGKKLEEIWEGYKIVDTPKGEWDGEMFIPLTDKQINKILSGKSWQ
jgi:hypothetical protein